MKKFLALVLALCMVLSLCACGAKEEAPAAAPAEEAAEAPAEKIKVGMVTDVGGVNDKSFNQTSWEGLQGLDPEVFEVAYLESKTDADYQTNINTFIDEEYDLIICVGYMLAGATMEAAEANPDQKFAIIDDATCADLPNVACLMFAQEEASFLVGVVAGMTTKSNVVGSVQVMVSESMNRFAVGYIAVAVTQSLSGILRGAGDTMTPMWISLFTTVVVRVPLAYGIAWATRSPEMPNGMKECIQISLLTTWIVGAVLTCIFYKIGKWKKKAMRQWEM